jgi:hypothetical protein
MSKEVACVSLRIGMSITCVRPERQITDHSLDTSPVKS